MSNEPVSLPPQKSRKQSAEEINHAMARFPLILQILRDLSRTQLPLPGDEEIRHGCERALTHVLSELARIQPALAGKAGKTEETALAWLQDANARDLIDADRLERMQQLIDSILFPSHH